MRPNGGDGKDLQQIEQYYGTVRKSCNQQSTNESVAGLERIPEYSEDIYPYATFHLPEHENESANIPLNCKGLYDARSGDENTISSTGIKRAIRAGDCGLTDTEKRLKRCSKPVKSESEEYDSLNSDSEISGERIRGVDSRSNSRDVADSLEDSFNPHGHSPRSSASKERLSLFNRSQLHKSILPTRKKENLHTSKMSSDADLIETRATAVAAVPITVKANRQPTVRSFLNAIIPLKVITTNITTSTSTSKHAPAPLNDSHHQNHQNVRRAQPQEQTTSFETSSSTELKNPLNIKHTPSAAHKFKPLHQPPLPASSDQSTLCLHSLTSSSTSSTSTSKHERTVTPHNSSSSVVVVTNSSSAAVTPTSNASAASVKKSRHSPCVMVVRKKHTRGDHTGIDSDGNHKRSFSTRQAKKTKNQKQKNKNCKK